MVTALSFSTAPALAKNAAIASVHSPADMPFTPAFGASLDRYRNCVLMQVDAQPLTSAAHMASEAMTACAIVRTEVQHQLASDIETQNPHHTQDIALTHAEGGMGIVDPMIEEAAIERAHMAFARVMI
ncbi:MAG: hypothetical protein AB7U35_12945 [Sphingobium sp.]